MLAFVLPRSEVSQILASRLSSPLPHHCPADSATGLPQPQLALKGQSLGNGTATEGRERGKHVCTLRKENPKRILIVDAFYCKEGKNILRKNEAVFCVKLFRG